MCSNRAGCPRNVSIISSRSPLFVPFIAKSIGTPGALARLQPNSTPLLPNDAYWRCVFDNRKWRVLESFCLLRWSSITWLQAPMPYVIPLMIVCLLLTSLFQQHMHIPKKCIFADCSLGSKKRSKAHDEIWGHRQTSIPNFPNYAWATGFYYK